MQEDVLALVDYSLEGKVALITLNRPDKRNALNDALLSALAEAAARATEEASAAVLAGNGQHFCAGLDLGEHAQKDLVQAIEGSRSWHAAFSKIQRGKIPFVSALHGAVVGGGMELASITHVRVAQVDTYFSMPEGRRGIFLGGGGSVNITRLFGVSRVMDMMLTGRVMKADEVERFGGVSYVVPNGDALSKAKELAHIIAENAYMSNYLTINALQRVHDSGYDEGLFFESMMASMIQNTPEAIAGLQAFLNKTAARLDIPTKDQK